MDNDYTLQNEGKESKEARHGLPCKLVSLRSVQSWNFWWSLNTPTVKQENFFWILILRPKPRE